MKYLCEKKRYVLIMGYAPTYTFNELFDFSFCDSIIIHRKEATTKAEIVP